MSKVRLPRLLAMQLARYFDTQPYGEVSHLAPLARNSVEAEIELTELQALVDYLNEYGLYKDVGRLLENIKLSAVNHGSG